jgi:hypothetical protein
VQVSKRTGLVRPNTLQIYLFYLKKKKKKLKKKKKKNEEYLFFFTDWEEREGDKSTQPD